MPSPTQVQQLFITYFKRPADANGLSFWSSSNASLETIADGFAGTPEYKLSINGKSLAQIINSFYVSLFNRNAEKGGLDFWVEQVSLGNTTTQQVGKFIAQAAANGPLNSDKIAIDSKTTAASRFTSLSASSTARNLSYRGDAAILEAVNFLKSVFNTQTIPTVSEVMTVLDTIVSGTSGTSTTTTTTTTTTPATGGGTNSFTLSTFRDIVGATGFQRFDANGIIQELSGNFRLNVVPQTITGTATTLQANDILVDASGTDTDVLNLTGFVGAVPAATVTNIETVNVTGAWATDVSLFTQGSISGGDLFDINGTIATHAAASNDLTINATNSGFSQINVAGITASGALAVAPTTVITADPNVGTTIVGSVLTDVIVGSGQADDINGGGGTDNISGGAGADTFRYTSAQFIAGEALDGGANTDTVLFSTAVNIADGAFANKTNLEAITLSNATNNLALGANARNATATLTVNGNDSVDNINASALNEAITILAGNGGDNLTGSNQADNITAGGGIDSVNGGAGNDNIILTETTGAVDTLVRNGDGTTDGYDTITGFTATNAVDIISFTSNAAKVGGNAVTGFASGALANLVGTTGFQVFSNNITVANLAIGPTEAEIETFLGATEVFQNGATNDSVYIAADNGAHTFIFRITEGADGGGADKQFDAGPDAGVAIMRIAGMTDATSLTAANLFNFT